MQQQGYRIVSADEYELPLIVPVRDRKATYFRVVPELENASQGSPDAQRKGGGRD